MSNKYVQMVKEFVSSVQDIDVLKSWAVDNGLENSNVVLDRIQTLIEQVSFDFICKLITEKTPYKIYSFSSTYIHVHKFDYKNSKIAIVSHAFNSHRTEW